MIDQTLIGRTGTSSYPPLVNGTTPTVEPTLNACTLLDPSKAALSNLLASKVWTSPAWTVDIAYDALVLGTNDWQKGFILWDWTDADGSRYQDYRPIEFATYDRVDPMVHVQDVKDYARVSSTTDDLLIARKIDEAHGDILTYLGCLIEAAEVVEYVAVTFNQSQLELQNRPVTAASFVDPGAGTWALDDFNQDLKHGIFFTGFRWDERGCLQVGTWTVTYTGGLDQRPDWAQVQRDLEGTELDWAAFLYNHRDAGAISLSDGDVSVSYEDNSGIPARVRKSLDKYRRWPL